MFWGFQLTYLLTYLPLIFLFCFVTFFFQPIPLVRYFYPFFVFIHLLTITILRYSFIHSISLLCFRKVLLYTSMSQTFLLSKKKKFQNCKVWILDDSCPMLQRKTFSSVFIKTSLVMVLYKYQSPLFSFPSL